MNGLRERERKILEELEDEVDIVCLKGFRGGFRD